MNRTLFSLMFILLIPSPVPAQIEDSDLEVIYRIKQEGSVNSSIEELSFRMTDFLGPRLTGSPGGERANEWARSKMVEFGFQNVRIEEAGDFGRGGWCNLKSYAAMTSPYYSNLTCNPVAWTGSTKGLVSGKVILLEVMEEADLEKYRGKLKDKIVLMPATTTYTVSYEPLAKRKTDEDLKQLLMVPSPRPEGELQIRNIINMMEQRKLMIEIAEFIRNEGVAVIINSSGIFNVPTSNGRNYISGETEPVAEINLPIEAHGRMVRLIKHDVPVEMEIEISNKFFENQKVYNVIGEIEGTDKVLKNEIVLIGAHFDSWHGGTGASDNASGCIVMMEALRILKELNISPRRTIRVALWGGEEQGLIGSRGYVDKYLADPETKEKKPDFDRFSVYFNMDNGTGKYRGIYLQGNDMARPIFEEWLRPFADMGATTVTIRRTGGTDHLSFDRAGLPGFQFIQDEIEYRRGYHTVMDTYERLVISDLKHNAIITAAFAYFAAMRDTKIPRKPEIKQHIENIRLKPPVQAIN